ncbi:MAG: ankyrin repeat domain-containing protein [Proteobacteria bacterium]|nr:MAG: ankyrin repeat domain-containing protein [Pseudomonadota bacterium]
MSDVPPIWYEFRDAVYCGEFQVAEKMLRETPSLLHMANGIGETALHFLAVEDDQRGVDWLRTKGFNIDTKNEFGTPVLFEVAQLGYKELCAWFIENGADLTAQDRDGRDIGEYLLYYDKSEMADWVRKLGA